MSREEFRLPEESSIHLLGQRVAEAGGRIVLVGGWVRDQLRQAPSKDYDLEVYGLPTGQVSEIVSKLGFTAPVGRHFPVWRLPREGIDLAYPRGDASAKQSRGNAAFESAFREAGRHRDLTINAIGWEPRSAALIDPWRGREDLAAGRLRAVDVQTFGSDPLRLLRVARLSAQLDAHADAQLAELCRGLDLSELPAERIAGELRRILTEPAMPSRAFEFLASIDRLDVFPLVAALQGVPQDPKWHPEGDVFVHTLRVLDCARELAEPLSSEAREILMFAALGHDLGKPQTTESIDGSIRSHGHEAESARCTRDWLDELRLPGRRVRGIEVLVANHLAPAQLVAQGAGPRAYRRLARKLAAQDLGLVDLERLARADHLGRTTPDALAGRFDAGVAFLEAAARAEVREGVREDVVKAVDLMQRGVEAGPELGRLLVRCREIEDETGWREVERIVERALTEGES